MAVVTVGVGQSIQAAIDAAAPGDTVAVAAGSYVDQFLTIRTSITLQAMGGEVMMTETVQPDNGKAMIVAGSPGATIAINGFDISGVSVPDSNGAAVRYEGGTLSLTDDYFHGNQEGLLGYNDDPNGILNITHSEFAFNGDGSGSTHNLYAGHMAALNITNSYFHDAIVGHEIKSRAVSTSITNSRIFDNNGSASYSVDVPNGGSTTISGNVIQQGAETQNNAIFAWGEEGNTNGGMMFITGNTVVNDKVGGYGVLASSPASFTNNQDWNLANLGNVLASGNTDLATRPTLDLSPLVFGGTTPPPPPPPVPPPVHGHGHGGGGGHGHHAVAAADLLPGHG